MIFKVHKIAMNGDPVVAQEPQGLRRKGGINLKEKRLRRKNAIDVEGRGLNCTACERKCNSAIELAAHRRGSYPR